MIVQGTRANDASCLTRCQQAVVSNPCHFIGPDVARHSSHVAPASDAGPYTTVTSRDSCARRRLLRHRFSSSTVPEFAERDCNTIYFSAPGNAKTTPGAPQPVPDQAHGDLHARGPAVRLRHRRHLRCPAVHEGRSRADPVHRGGRGQLAALPGRAFGALLGGKLADELGRKGSLLVCAGLFLVGALICATRPQRRGHDDGADHPRLRRRCRGGDLPAVPGRDGARPPARPHGDHQRADDRDRSVPRVRDERDPRCT